MPPGTNSSLYELMIIKDGQEVRLFNLSERTAMIKAFEVFKQVESDFLETKKNFDELQKEYNKIVSY